MGLFGKRRDHGAVLEGRHQVLVVGESFYQDALLAIAGPKGEEGACHACLATLVCEPSNPYDPNAVAVTIDGRKVGHLNREQAAMVCKRLAARRSPCTVRAQVNGGWDRGKGDTGHFGVVIWLPEVEQL